jgi:choline dehydrogenase-like flavoprotein
VSAAQEPVIIIGAGPAGTSAALALRERGVPVHMLDAGSTRISLPPKGDVLGLRFGDPNQWRWQIGANEESLSAPAEASPKFRIPGLRAIFEGYAEANRMSPDANFHLAGALAAGGMSNAWGCGVARFDADELGALAADREAMDASCDRVGRRMGLSGQSDDALSEYLGLDALSAPALPLDALHQRLWQRRSSMDGALRIGRARVAVLNEPRLDRAACNLSGMCLWGCSRRSTWSAVLDVEMLKRDPGVQFDAGVVVDAMTADGSGGWWLETHAADGPRRYRARNVLLAAGTLATTRLALAALPDPPAQVRLQSNPMAAFLLCLPAMLGTPRERAFGLAQLSFALARPEAAPGFGNLFSTVGLPVSEFLAHLPISRRAGLPLLRTLLPSCVVGNLFLPGELSAHSVSVDAGGTLRVRGGSDPRLETALVEARSELARGFRKLGAWMLPGSFVAGPAGADLHYASTLPISTRPLAHECQLNGELAGLPGVFVLDGAGLPILPAKAHTLTIMANADRIARSLQVALR